MQPQQFHLTPDMFKAGTHMLCMGDDWLWGLGSSCELNMGFRSSEFHLKSVSYLAFCSDGLPFFSDWSTCQLSEKAVCGNGIKTRMLDCVRSDGKSVDLRYCEEVGGCCVNIFVSKFFPNNFSSCWAKWPVLHASHCQQMFFCTIHRLSMFLKRYNVQYYWFLHIISCIFFSLEPKSMLISPFWKKCLGNNK